MNAKVLTVEEATRILPQVKKIFARAKELRAKISSRGIDYEFMQIGTDEGGGAGVKQTQMRTELEQLMQEFQQCAHALDTLGAHIKSFDPGVVDFFSVRDGRVVFLCWQEGEDEIGHWHELDAGVAGRQPI